MNYSNPKTNTHLYYFDSIDDICNYIVNNSRGNEKSWWSTRKVNRWSGNMTFQQAFNKFKYGDDELAEQIENVELEDDLKIERLTNEYLLDIQGIVPHVPNAILGLPQSMINISRTRVKSNHKILNLVYDLSVNCAVDADDYTKVSKLFLNIIDKLEILGYRCSIYVLIQNRMDNIISYKHDTHNTWMLKLKDSSEPFNRYKCAFILGHVGMFRRIGFRLIELESHSDPDSCAYGETLSAYERNSLIEHIFKDNNIPVNNYKVFNIYEHIHDTEDDIIKSISFMK